MNDQRKNICNQAQQLNKIVCFLFIVVLFVNYHAYAQINRGVDYYLLQTQKNNPALQSNKNLEQIGNYQNDLIIAQNKSFQVYASSDLLFAPFFNSNGKPIDVTANPSANAFGYDAGITNGGLYSAQLNVTKNLFNQSAIDNLSFQNKVKNDALKLSYDEVVHNFNKNISDLYVNTYQLQLQKKLTQEILSDLQIRLKVVELLVKRAILMESDYLLLQLDIESKQLELKQIENNLKTSIDQLYTMSNMPLEKIDSISKPNISATIRRDGYFYIKKFQNDSLQAVADLAVLNNQYKPQLSAFANTGLNAVEFRNIDHKIGASAGLHLVIPLYDGKQRKYTGLQNTLKNENLEYYRKNAEIQLQNQIESLQRQIQNTDENMILMEKQLVKQRKIMEIYKGKLVQGQVSIVDYLNVIQSYKQNVFTKLQMQTNYWLLINQYNFINW